MKRQTVYRILFVICAAAFLVSAGVLFSYWKSYEEGDSEYEAIAKGAVMTRQDAEENAPSAGEEEQQPDKPKEKLPLVIDFDALKAANGECVAWIDFPGQDISYPVVKGTDNDHYLHYTFNGTRNAAGSIFQDSRNGEMMEDSNTIIYGHNMKNGSMFGLLKKYREQEHLTQYPFFDVYTPDAGYRCQIIMAGNVRARGEYYQVSFSGEEARSQYLKLMKENSWYELPEAVSDEDVPQVEYIRSLVADDGRTGEAVSGTEGGAAEPAETDGEESAEPAETSKGEPETPGGAPPLVLLSTCTGGSHAYRFVLLGQVVKFYEN